MGPLTPAGIVMEDLQDIHLTHYHTAHQAEGRHIGLVEGLQGKPLAQFHTDSAAVVHTGSGEDDQDTSELLVVEVDTALVAVRHIDPAEDSTAVALVEVHTADTDQLVDNLVEEAVEVDNLKDTGLEELDHSLAVERLLRGISKGSCSNKLGLEHEP